MPDGRRMLTAMIGEPYPAPALAADVLAGVARNRAVIVTPRHARVAWRTYRLSPRLVMDLAPRHMARRMRRQAR
jgi:hypothetical protein